MFLLLGLGAYFGYTQGGLSGKQAAKGRWVYDRSLGGKKVRFPLRAAHRYTLFRHALASPLPSVVTVSWLLSADQATAPDA